MEDEMNVLSNATCNDFSQPVFIAVTVVRAFSGTLSALCSIFVILIILVFKKYLVFPQRLILYLSISTTFNGLARATQGINYPYYPDNEQTNTYCIAAGFIEMISRWMVLMSTAVIMFYLYMKTVHLRDLKWEVAYVIAIFVFPLLYCWIPFINLTYGEAGAWCWIRRIKEDCTNDIFGIMLRYGLFFIPSYIVLFTMLILFVKMYLTVKWRKPKMIWKFDPIKEKEYKHLLDEIKVLIWYPIILIIIQLPSIINRIAEETYGIIIPLWFIHALIYPLQGGFICTVYALDPDTRKRLRKCSWRSLVSNVTENTKVDAYEMAEAYTDSLGTKFHMIN